MADMLERLKIALADRYRIERELGSGGMGTVYLAHDTRHEREVAVKVLRPELAATLGAERFLREIKIAAKLHHPHILPLYDSGETEGFLYYVMPYEAGQSLREKLAKEGELPIQDAIRVLRDVVDALAHAHKHGVVHRDIKPDNVLLSGRHALVTDFGVAKAVSEATGREQFTTTGVALGTPSYMAPEQASADPSIDHRADIYGLGVVAYEVLAGKPPFWGTSPQQVLSSHVTQTPELVTSHRAAISPALSHFVMKCLEKKPADRWQTAEEMLQILEPLLTPSGGITPTSTQPVRAIQKLLSKTTVIVIGMLALVIFAGTVLMLSSRGPIPLQVGPQKKITYGLGLEVDPAISPNGEMMAYAAGPAGQMHIYVQQIEGGGAIALTEGLPGNFRSPRWNPGGTRIAFQSAGSIFSMPALGGNLKRLVEPAASTSVSDEAIYAPHPDNPAWSPDGTQIAYVWQTSAPSLASQRRENVICVQSIDGGEPREIAKVIEAHSLHWSPDGSLIAYVSGASLFIFGTRDFGNVDPSSIWVVPAAGGDPVRVTDDDCLNVSPVWMPDGKQLLFVSDRNGIRDLYQVAISSTGRPSGTPLRITTGLNAHTIEVSTDGKKLAYSVFTHRANLWSLAIPQGIPVSISEAQPLTNEAQVIEVAEVSRDGRWLAFDSNREGNQDIYKVPVAGGVPEQLTTHPSDDYAPSWSPDEREVVFYSLRNGNRDIYVMSADGGAVHQLTSDPAQDRHPAWSPNGNDLVFASDRTGRHELFLITRQSERSEWGTPEQLTFDGGFLPRWSPEGLEIVYRSDPSQSLRIFSPDRGESRVLVRAQDIGLTPAYADWSSDGRTIYYTAYQGENPQSVWSIPSGGGSPILLVRFDDPSRKHTRYSFTSDGEHFLFVINQFESDISIMELINKD